MAQTRSTPKFYANETDLPDREVRKVLLFVLKYLEVENKRCFVKVKYTNGFGAYGGRFYPHARQHAKYIYDRRINDYKEIAPTIPSGFDHLIVCRIQRPNRYPMSTHVYDRKDSPGTWIVENWQEALVSITAHEAQHLRQFTISGAKRGRRWGFSEVDTEWAAFRLWKEWKEKHG